MRVFTFFVRLILFRFLYSLIFCLEKINWLPENYQLKLNVHHHILINMF